MRVFSRLYSQHLGWSFKKHWQLQRKRIVNDTGAANVLQKHGIQVRDSEIVRPKLKKLQLEIEDYRYAIIPEDESYSHWKQRLCHMYGDENVLLEGVHQAQVLTNTIKIKGFPKPTEDYISKMQLHNNVDRQVHEIIMASQAFDAEQVKLPKVKVLDRPAFNLPRAHGTSQSRRNRLLINRLISECQKFSGKSANSRRRFFDHASFLVTVSKGNDLIQLQLSAEKFITSSRPIEQVKVRFDGELPDLYPLKCTISLPRKNIYTTEFFYPLSNKIDCSHPHTIITFYNKESVGNLHGVEVTTTQFQSRTMLKTFAVAAARAKQLYGERTNGNLPKPIVVQGIHTDGRTFHFGTLQLNTLNLDDAGDSKNYWFHEPNMDLFAECGYKSGRPYLQGYNRDVFRCLNAFYNNA